jgi:signal transduction histidine kinase/HAMP domain-containing protein
MNHQRGSDAMSEFVPAFRSRLSTKLSVAVLAFLLLLTTAVLLVVDFNLRRTRANTSALSSAGLLAQGEVALLKITTREAELSNRVLHKAAGMTQIAADYMAETHAANSPEAGVGQHSEQVWRADQLMRRADGTFYDPNPRRRSDVYIPSLDISDAQTDRILRESAPLDLLFPILLSQTEDVVALYYQDTTQFVTRYYPVIGLAQVIGIENTPSRGELEAMNWHGTPEQNPDRLTVWNQPYVDLAGHGLLVTGFTPIYFGDEYRGLIAADVSLARLAERLKNLRPTPNAYGFLIDGNGQLIAAPGEKIDSLLGVDVPDEETANGSALARSLLQSEHAELRAVVAHMQAGESGSAPVELGDEPVVIAYAPLPDLEWSLGVVAPTSDIVADAATVAAEIERDIDDTLRATLLTIAVFSLVAMVAATFVGRSLTQPVSSLVAGTRAITGGDLTVRLPITSRDELGLLASSFNEMTSELRDAYQHLEQRVAARTRELTTLLEISRNVALTMDLEPLLELVLDQLKTVIDYTGASILVLEEEEYVVRAYRGPAPREATMQVRLSVHEYYSQHMLATRQPIIIDDVRANTPEAHLAASGAHYQTTLRYVRSYLGAPLIVREHMIGVLNLHHSEPGHFNGGHAELAMAFANQAAGAIHNARLFDTVQRRAEQFRVISELGRRITTILAVDELLVQTARSIRDSFGYYHVHIGFVEGDEVVYKTGAAWDDPQFQLCESTRLKVGQEGFVGWVAATGEPLLVPDSAKDPRNVAIEGDPTRSELVLPLKIKGEVIGVLDIESDQVNAFDELDVAVLQSLASQVAVAIENARLFHAVQRRAEQFRAIGEMGNRITSILDVDKLLSQTVHMIHNTFGYYHAHIGLVEEGFVVFPAAAGVWRDEPRCHKCGLLRFRVGQDGISGHVAATGGSLLVPDINQDARYVPMENGQVGSALALPLKARGQVIGVLNVESDDLDAFDESDMSVLQSLANQVAVAIENARLYQEAGKVAALQERQRLARELHDSVSQALYGIALGTRTAISLLARDSMEAEQAATLRQPLDYVMSLAEAGLAEMRALIFELRPESLEMEGVVAALTRQTDALRARHGLEVFTAFGAEPDMPLLVKETLYRVAQEALHNIVKHAQANRVEVELTTDGDGTSLEIKDNGRGFDTQAAFPGHLGLRSMRERVEGIGGTFQVVSKPDQGTCIRVEVRRQAIPLAP